MAKTTHDLTGELRRKLCEAWSALWTQGREAYQQTLGELGLWLERLEAQGKVQLLLEIEEEEGYARG